MPSIREGFHCSECPLADVQMPFSNNDVEKLILDSARAVAAAAGYDGQLATDKSLQNKAQDCAEQVTDKRCPMWVATDAGFVIRDGRHSWPGTDQ